MRHDKGYYRKKAGLMIALYGSLLFSLGSFTYLSYAWFTSQRTASVNFNSIKVTSGFSLKIKYLSYNSSLSGSTPVYHGYKRGDIATLDTSFTYAANFLDVTDTSSSGPLGGIYFAPLYASTYCFEVTYDGGATPFNVYLSSFSSPASTSAYSDTLSAYISLSEAVDVFTGFSDGTNLDSDAKTFLEATTGDSATDRFNHTGTSLAADTTDSWNPAMTMSSVTGGTVYFFVTEYFSNDASTFYSPVSGSDGHYVHDTAGNSNPYQGLSIVLSGVTLDRG